MTKQEALDCVRNAYGVLMDDRTADMAQRNAYASEFEEVIAALSEETPRKGK
jgi:hypothetical protein